MSGLSSDCKRRGIALLVVQALLVLSIAGKYLYERKTCPRVWAQAAQYDPNQPLRGRYLSLQLSVNACGLPMDEAHHMGPIDGSVPHVSGYHQWTVRLRAEGGKLALRMADNTDRPETTEEATVWGNQPCYHGVLSQSVDYYIPDTTRTPFPLKKGQVLWVEVTVPRMGPPRPIQLAMSENGVFSPLRLR